MKTGRLELHPGSSGTGMRKERCTQAEKHNALVYAEVKEKM